MRQRAENASPWRQLIDWLREEFAPTPGRGAATARIAANCTIVVIISMVFEIPLPAYSAWIVFMVARDEYVATLLFLVGGAIAGTLAVMLSLLFYMIDAAEPALRIPLMALSTFVGMFLVRASVLGPLAFLAGFLLVLTQTLIDAVPSTEMLTRFVLWLWVVVMLPAALTTVVDLALGRNPGKLALQTGLRLLDAITAALQGQSVALAERQAEAVKLLELREHAQIADPRLRALGEVDHRLIATLVELLTLLHALPTRTPAEIRRWLVEESRACRLALASKNVPVPLPRALPAELRDGLDGELLPIVTAIVDALGRLRDDIESRRAGSDAPHASAKMPLLVADAWSNPEYARFALKVTIAVMAAYFIYSMLDWPGIRTSVTTCFFVALSTFGETVHKFTLRIVGASMGGLLATLCIVYALPEMTDIGQLALLIGAVAAIGGWIATSSERLSYLGNQLAFAFFIGVLHDYGPTMELTTLRDRVVGIFLGNVLIAIVFSTMWPKSALEQAREAIAQALRALGDLIRGAAQSRVDMRLTAVQKVAEARHLVSIAMFEAHLLERGHRRESYEETAAQNVDRLAAAAFVVAAQPARADIGEAARLQDAATAKWFDDSARRVAVRRAPPPPPARPGVSAQAVLSPATPSLLRAAIDARVFLQREIEHVASVPR
ncbi:MAG TPA: FUSC family protein [Gemmatimonadaceae bacterium]|jgi:multidrug resistance protein MdtO|nr:FUSC family protein [Gemmatimonadaceae bacterium]